jgi:hypothetical protein
VLAVYALITFHARASVRKDGAAEDMSLSDRAPQAGCRCPKFFGELVGFVGRHLQRLAAQMHDHRRDTKVDEDALARHHLFPITQPNKIGPVPCNEQDGYGDAYAGRQLSRVREQLLPGPAFSFAGLHRSVRCCQALRERFRPELLLDLLFEVLIQLIEFPSH